MKPGIPWSVKGIEPEVREAAKHAARRAGMTLGEWLNSVILENEPGSTAEGGAESAPAAAQNYAEANISQEPHATRPAARRNEGSVRLEDIAQQLSRLAQRERESATIQPYERPQPAAADRDQLDRILYRMDRSEQQTVEAFTAMNERLSVLGHQIASQPKPKTFEKAEDVPGYTALDHAIRNVIGHIEVSEKRTRESLKSMQDRLSEMSERATRPSNPDELLKAAPAFNSLEARFAELSNRIQRSENLLHAGLPDLVKKEINQLADRIENVRASTEAVARQAETEAVKVARGELRDIESRILGVLKEAQSLIGSQHTTGADLQKVRAEIGGLNRRIDDVKAATASEHDVHALRVAVEQLSTRVAQGPDMRPLAEMDRRIGELSRKIDQHQPDLRPVYAQIDKRAAELSQRIEQTQPDLRPFAAEVDKKLAELSAKIDNHQPDMRPFAAEIDRRISDLGRKVEQGTSAVRSLPQFGELEKRIAELDHRLGEAMRMQGDQQAVQRLEEHIAAVNDRVARTEEQLGHLETMERAIRQLYDSLEQNRETAGQAAEDAANRAVERFLAMQPQTGGPSPELEALEQGLRAVRESASSAEQRNQETLEAVHETLEQIVSKLAELETSAAGHQVAAAMAQQASERVVEQAAAQVQQPQSAAPAPQSFFDPSGVFEAPAYAAPPTAAPLAAQPAAAPAAAPVAAPPAPDFSAGATGAMPDDFIAAARRAAQAAATRPAAAAAAEPKAEAEGKPAKGSKLKLPQIAMPSFLKGSKKLPEPIVFVNGKPVVDPGAAANTNSSQRRKLVLIGIVLLTAVSAFAFTMVAKTKPPKQTSAIEHVMPEIPSDEPAQISGEAATLTERTDLAAAARPLPANVPSTGLVDAPSADPMATGSLPARKTDATLSSIVSQPSEGRAEMPPPETGTEALRRAAAMGDAKAQFIIASRYLDGQGVAQDLPKAAHWYQLSAERGLAPAQYRLATLFERGKGVPQDIATALLWYERAAEGGNVKAMHNAAVIAAGNQAGTPNYDKAFRWFKSAAEMGLHDSQFNLAVLNERGLGTKVDPAEAFFWYSLAGNQGDQDAVARAAKIARTMTGEQAAQLSARVNAWQPAAQNTEGNVVAVSDPAWQASDASAAAAPADPAVDTDGIATASVSPAAMLEPGEPAQPMMDSNASTGAPATPVAEAQALLNKLGYNVGANDGRMGSRTANAIRLFQLQSGLKVTGEVTPDVIEAMRERAS